MGKSQQLPHFNLFSMDTLITIETLQNIPDKEYFAIARNEISTKIITHRGQFALIKT